LRIYRDLRVRSSKGEATGASFTVARRDVAERIGPRPPDRGEGGYSG